MSIFSDYAHGYLSEEEVRSACAQMNKEEEWAIAHEYGYGEEYDNEEDEDDD